MTEYAWQHHFVTNMFLRPSADEVSESGIDHCIRSIPLTLSMTPSLSLSVPRTSNSQVANFGEPDFTIINGCNVTNEDWEKDGVSCCV